MRSFCVRIRRSVEGEGGWVRFVWRCGTGLLFVVLGGWVDVGSRGWGVCRPGAVWALYSVVLSLEMSLFECFYSSLQSITTLSFVRPLECSESVEV